MQLPRLVLAIACAVAACHSSPAPSAPSAPAPAAGPTPATDADPHAGHDHARGKGHSWDDTYRAGVGFRLEPNRLLMSAVQGVKPGKALDIGMGQGRNAVFLATQGWNVTGVDTSAEGIRIAGENAKALGVTVNGVVQDIAAFDMGKDRYDLIAMIYMDDRRLVERMRTALKPGGLVVIEFFHSDSNDYFPHPLRGFDTGELERLFAGFQIVRSDIVEDVADFGQRPAKLVRFVARKK